jgi:hypothetical protein
LAATVKSRILAGIATSLNGISIYSVCPLEGIPVASRATATDIISFTESVQPEQIYFLQE